MRKRRAFAETLKAKVALEAIKGLKSTSELASEYDVHPQMVTLWKRELLENASKIFTKGSKLKKKPKHKEEENLYKKIGQLQMEVDFLKKCADSLR